MKYACIAALAVFAAAPIEAMAKDCNWKFSINNQTGTTITIDTVHSRTTAIWKRQWYINFQTIEYEDGEKSLLPRANVGIPPGYSFSTDTACKANKEIDFKVDFRCVFEGDEIYRHTRIAKNRVRDGEHTVKITACSDVTTG